MNFSVRILAFAATFLSANIVEAAPAGNLVIEFEGRMCTTIDPNYESSFRCDPSRQKIVALGNKILWHDSADTPKGVVFTLDKVVDLTTDRDNQFFPAQGLNAARESRTAYATWSGDTLQLLMLAEGFSKKNKRVYSYRHEFFVRTDGTGRCDILNWHQGGFTGYKANKLYFRLRDATCRYRKQ